MLLSMEMNELVNWIIINFICEMVFAIIDVFLFTNLFKIETVLKTRIKMVLLDGVLRTVFLIVIPTPYNKIVNLVIAVLLFKLFFKAKIEKCILGEVINSITVLVPETILAKIFCVLIFYANNYL